jgi:hypothetical protein
MCGDFLRARHDARKKPEGCSDISAFRRGRRECEPVQRRDGGDGALPGDGRVRRIGDVDDAEPARRLADMDHHFAAMARLIRISYTHTKGRIQMWKQASMAAISARFMGRVYGRAGEVGKFACARNDCGCAGGESLILPRKAGEDEGRGLSSARRRPWTGVLALCTGERGFTLEGGAFAPWALVKRTDTIC